MDGVVLGSYNCLRRGQYMMFQVSIESKPHVLGNWDSPYNGILNRGSWQCRDNGWISTKGFVDYSLKEGQACANLVRPHSEQRMIHVLGDLTR